MFHGAHPNNHAGEETYLTVERKNGDNWDVVADDSAWETTYKWARKNIMEAQSLITILWDIPATMGPGAYHSKHLQILSYYSLSLTHISLLTLSHISLLSSHPPLSLYSIFSSLLPSLLYAFPSLLSLPRYLSHQTFRLPQELTAENHCVQRSFPGV